MFTMFFLVKLTIAIVIVCGILSPILASPHKQTVHTFLEDTKRVLDFPDLHILCNRHGGVNQKAVKQTRIRRQQYFQQYESAK
ncbi:pilJ [Escherichia coli]|uniref:pilJ n=1 Tax=Escherichia coli TaxID=562 RepID=UPI002FCCF73F